MPTIATLLSGGEGVGMGAKAAGLSHLWGIEIDDDIAGVARDNGFNVITGDILQIDPQTLEAPDVLHASPECQNASNAKHDPEADTLEEKETRGDVEIAGSIVRYLEVLRPRVFTLENVYGYRRFQSFKKIMIALAHLGYFSDVQHLNASDFGVPQSRKRLIVRAVRGGLVPSLPAPEPWRGWYAAIKDLIPTLPMSEFAPWQKARLPEILTETILVESKNANQQYGDGMRRIDEPAMTVVTDHKFSHRPTAFILAQGGYDGNVVRAEANSPCFTVTANSNQGELRAFVIGSHYADSNDKEDRRPQKREADEPYFTVTVSGGQHKDARAWLSRGHVVKMTPRCLARFQSFPDSYELPEHNGLACRVIGNAVPVLMYEKIARQFL